MVHNKNQDTATHVVYYFWHDLPISLQEDGGIFIFANCCRYIGKQSDMTYTIRDSQRSRIYKQ